MVKQRIIPIPKPHIRLSTTEELERFLKKDQNPSVSKTKTLKKLCRIKHHYSNHHKKLVILLRYGSMTDFSTIQYGWKEIGNLTGINSSTCYEMVKAFHLKGDQLIPGK